LDYIILPQVCHVISWRAGELFVGGDTDLCRQEILCHSQWPDRRTAEWPPDRRTHCASVDGVSLR